MRRNVGRIRLQHDGGQGQGAGQPAQLQRTVKRHRATKTELEAQVDKCLRLLCAAVEGMGDALPAVGPDLAQVFEQLVGRAPHVQDHRQAMAAGQT